MVKKTLFKLFLSLAMLFSILPTTVMAEDTVHFSGRENSIDDFITLLQTTSAKNVIVDDYLLVEDGASREIDFSGHTVTCKYFLVDQYSKLTMKGGSTGKWVGQFDISGGTTTFIDGTYEDQNCVILLMEDIDDTDTDDFPKVVIKGGTYIETIGGNRDSYVVNMENGSLSIQGGSFIAKECSVIAVFDFDTDNSEIKSVSLTGGTYTVENLTALNNQEETPFLYYTNKTVHESSIINPATTLTNVKFSTEILGNETILYIDAPKWVVTGKPTSIVTSATSYPYTGSTIKPAVTIKDAFGKVIPATNYTVAYSNNKNIGTATIKVTFKGIYTGTLSKTFTITPKKMSIKSISKGKNYLTVKWNKDSKVKGYQIRYATKSNMSGAKTVTISKYKTTSKKITKLKRKTKYYVQIRSYKTVGGKTIYSPWSSKKSATTK